MNLENNQKQSDDEIQNMQYEKHVNRIKNGTLKIKKDEMIFRLPNASNLTNYMQLAVIKYPSSTPLARVVLFSKQINAKSKTFLESSKIYRQNHFFSLTTKQKTQVLFKILNQWTLYKLVIIKQKIFLLQTTQLIQNFFS
ncbi:Hypothetical_protein [Hexamita inflata]|uniref:Hypothetical_protein n=1 Tax=Hexamita inflata TaxID=28002 RepID=A0AA86U1K0_9EUKA|nr:Hypothetical protein HINF_LOCUS24449 [Hexamita inflata]